MTIEKGKEWGTAIVVPSDVITVHSDHELAQQDSSPLLFVTGGDVCDVLGQPVVPVSGEQRRCVPIDALLCTITTSEGTITTMAASSILVGSLLKPKSRFIVISNTGQCGRKNYAPRAHPNDGKCDVVIFGNVMPIRQRFIAARRLHTGTHIPHPTIAVSQVVDQQVERRANGERLVIDGKVVPGWTSLAVHVIADYWHVIV